MKGHNFQSMSVVDKGEPVIPIVENKFYLIKAISLAEKSVDKKGILMDDYIKDLFKRIDEIVG